MLTESDRGDPTPLRSGLDAALLRQGGAATLEWFREPSVQIDPGQLNVEQAADHPLPVIPAGGLSGLSQNEQFKSGLESYVRMGGTAVVFAQQHGTSIRG